MKNIPTVVYPETPANVDERVILPSTEFKGEVKKVMSSIVSFIAVYIALMIGSILLALLCGYGGIMLIAVFPKLVTIMIGLGLLGLGTMVIFFLLKFLFKENVTDRSHLTLITEKDQPELFAFIKRLTKETQSPFPKNIYLSPDVNASVFYDSSFWSMFFPIRKNLQIGLGLVNSVNISEFKAILAHEFGHFSQRSMKLGSYVYNVNQVIFNMLYDNDGYGKTIQGWASISGYFAFFAEITMMIVYGIQKILRGMYSVINKNYMSLSRQMEFHADAVAAYVTGADHLVTSLRRLEVANICYDRLFQQYNSWYHLNVKPDNIYPQHVEIMKHFAQDHGLHVDHDLPQVNSTSFANFNKSRVVVKNQWASHPSTDDREDHLNKLNIHTDTDHSSAWIIFKNAQELQQQQTEKIYGEVEFKQPPQNMGIASFKEKYGEETEKYSLNKRYKGFYNNRKIADVDVKNLDSITPDSALTLEDVLDDKSLSLPAVIEWLTADIQIIQMIEQGTMPVKTFDFNGKKYDNHETSIVRKILEEELKETQGLLAEADKRIICFFLRRAEARGEKETLISKYHQVSAAASEAEEDVKKFATLMEVLRPLFQSQMTLEQAYARVNQVKLHEAPIKKKISEILDDESYTLFYSSEERTKLQKYCKSNFKFFSQGTFLNDEFEKFREAIQFFHVIVFERSFGLKKDLLEWQLSV